MSGDGQAVTARPPTSNAKLAQLAGHVVPCPGDGKVMRSVFSAAPVDNTDTSLRAGPRGPVAIEDPVAREKVSHFDHERIPERVVHARGAGAHGVFILKESLESVTCAKVLTQVGKETPMFVRFSTVLGSNGAAETAREVRGFASRFYTEDGNWDIVGNNIPVFFIQDGIKFPDLIHAGKPEPQAQLPQAQTAHDSFWDFISLMPESTAMAMWTLSDYTIPRSYRMMKGFGVNTFVLVSAQGARTFVKFHWRPHLGTHALVWDEALKLGGQDPDFMRRDLADNIEVGAFPKWDFGVQLVPEANEHSFEFDLLDCTKLIPEEQVPIKWVGELTLNRNPTNYHAETEQVAFCTSNVVPGIDYSADPMLQLRNFSYFDTQLSRLGGPNFNQIPINQPICPFISTIRDGSHQHRIPAGPHYYPNRFEVPTVAQKDGANFATSDENIKKATSVGKDHSTFAPYAVDGLRGRLRAPKFKEYKSQAQLFWNSMSDVEKKHIISAAIFELGRCQDSTIRERMVARFGEVDASLAKAVAEGLDVPLPADLDNSSIGNRGQHSVGQNPLSMLSKNNAFTAAGRKVAVFALDGYDGLQATAMVAALTGLGVVPVVIGSRKGHAYPAGVKVGDKNASHILQTDFDPEGCRSTYFDGLYFPSGGDAYVESLAAGRIVHYAREAFGHFKTIGATGAAVSWLMHTALAGSLDLRNMPDKKFTSYKGVVLGPNITDEDVGLWKKIAEGPKDLVNYGSAYAEALAAHRHWDRDVSKIAF